MTARIQFREALDWRTAESLNRATLWGFIILGILFRLRQYLFDRSLWLDESLLALNIIRRSPTELLKPLDHAQGAPIGFLWLEKLAVHSLGPGEMTLRLVPFLAGLGSIFLFVMVARRFLTPGAVLIAVALFSFCSPLIYYSSEAKQYSIDVAVALLLYLMSSPMLEFQLGTMRVIALSLAGAFAIWLSHPAAFVLAVLGFQMMMAHEALTLPRFIGVRPLPAQRITRLVDRIIPVMEALETFIRPRWHTPFTATNRLVGLIVILLALTILIPIPFSNIVPGALTMLVAFAYLEEDGILLFVALIASVASLVITGAEGWAAVMGAHALIRV